MKQGEIVQGVRQVGNDDFVVADLDGGGVADSSAVQPQAAQAETDEAVDRVPILDVEKGPAVPENLGGVIGLDAEALSQVNLSPPVFPVVSVRRFVGRRSTPMLAGRAPCGNVDARRVHRGTEVFVPW
jgi:hypothetical protein